MILLFIFIFVFLAETKQHTPVHEDKISLKKVLDLVNKNDDQGLRDMNKKLQHMLEETLTKNMHLQQVNLSSYTPISIKRRKLNLGLSRPGLPPI